MSYDDQNLFAKILRGEIPCDRVYEDDVCLAFRDIQPQAPQHVLMIPKAPIACVAEATEEHAALLGQMMLRVGDVARAEGFAEEGFRVVINNGAGAQQTVFHLHLHILAGRPMEWPPG